MYFEGFDYEQDVMGTYDIMYYNPLLMIKDFNATGFSTDYTFMTNADTPTYALQGIVENPVNPFTGNPINNDAKFAPEQHIFLSEDWSVNSNNGTTFNWGTWISLSNQDIFDEDNWEVIGEG